MKKALRQKELKSPRTKGLVKLISNFEGMIDTPAIQDMIKNFRTTHDVVALGDIYGCMCCSSDEYTSGIKDILSKMGIYGVEWEEILNNYIKTNSIDRSFYDRYGFENDVCAMYDTEEEEREKDQWLEGDIEDIRHYREMQDIQNKQFPIVLRISPYASMNDITAYLKRFSEYLTKVQNKYKQAEIKIGGYKKRIATLTERNNFIYEHRHLPRKEIVLLVKGVFNLEVDVQYVRNIISKIKKRNNK